MLHYFQNFSSDDQDFDDFCMSQKSNACLISDLSGYNDLGGEWDLFEEPQPITEQPLVSLNHMPSSTSMILCEEDFISQEIKSTDVESFQSDYFLNNLYYEFKNILLEVPSSPSHALDSKLPETGINSPFVKENMHIPGKITKSVSSESLMYVNGDQVNLNAMELSEMDSKKVYGMRWAFSEGHIKTDLIEDHTTQTRMQKLSRYRDKKTKRNFRRKVKYACRKMLADSQPRVKGRFAKTEETDVFDKVITRF